MKQQQYEQYQDLYRADWTRRGRAETGERSRGHRFRWGDGGE